MSDLKKAASLSQRLLTPAALIAVATCVLYIAGYFRLQAKFGYFGAPRLVSEMPQSFVLLNALDASLLILLILCIPLIARWLFHHLLDVAATKSFEGKFWRRFDADTQTRLKQPARDLLAVLFVIGGSLWLLNFSTGLGIKAAQRDERGLMLETVIDLQGNTVGTYAVLATTDDFFVLFSPSCVRVESSPVTRIVKSQVLMTVSTGKTAASWCDGNQSASGAAVKQHQHET